MVVLIEIIQKILSPLSVGLTFTAILAGICLGVFYNYPLNIDNRMIFHKAVAGWIFILFVFIYRIVTGIVEGRLTIVTATALGWIGIAILWGIFCASIYVTHEVAESILIRRLNHK